MRRRCRKAGEESPKTGGGDQKLHGGTVTALAALADSPHEFFSGGADSLVRRWNAQTSKQLAEFKSDAAVVALAVSAKAHRIAAASATAIKMWDENGKFVAPLSSDARSVLKLARIDADIVFTKGVIGRSENDLKSYEGLIRGATVTMDAVKMAEDERTKAIKTRDDKKEALEKLKAENEKAEKPDKTKLEAAESMLLATAETAAMVSETVIERAKRL